MAARLRACLLQHERQVLRLEGFLRPGKMTGHVVASLGFPPKLNTCDRALSYVEILRHRTEPSCLRTLSETE